jgi:hypothetical protein
MFPLPVDIPDPQENTAHPPWTKHLMALLPTRSAKKRIQDKKAKDNDQGNATSSQTTHEGNKSSCHKARCHQAERTRIKVPAWI